MFRKFMTSVGFCYIGLAIVVVSLSFPLLLGWVKPNPWYGIRIPQAFLSHDHWYALNRFGGRLLIFYGLGLAVARVLVLYFREIQSQLWYWFVVLAPFLPLPFILWSLFRFANRLPPP